ncbi:sesquipedalian-2-like [Lineus longissimus]|uniref:sesquipedalian-2-like n=1 Tax=Lineus longissimus TaxID=88925 RepID=UPI00315C745F
MKINDKNLVLFATCNSPVDKEGHLMKKGEVNKGYQKRWFILKGNLLFYFEKKGDKEPIGVIVLEGCTVELFEQQTDAYTFAIKFPGPGCRSYILAADNQEEMETWMRAITCAGYEYMKLMVAELQRQLEEHNQQLLDDAKSEGLSKTETLQASYETPSQSSNGDDSAPNLMIRTSNPSRRFNPFNSCVADTRSKGSAVFHMTVDDGPVAGPSNVTAMATTNSVFFDDSGLLMQPKSFEEMHELYGRKIKLRMAESKPTTLSTSDDQENV